MADRLVSNPIYAARNFSIYVRDAKVRMHDALLDQQNGEYLASSKAFIAQLNVKGAAEMALAPVENHQYRLVRVASQNGISAPEVGGRCGGYIVRAREVNATPGLQEKIGDYNQLIALLPDYPDAYLCPLYDFSPEAKARHRKFQEKIIAQLGITQEAYFQRRHNAATSSIFSAAYYGDIDGIKRNLDQINDVDDKSKTALYYALEQNQLKAFEFLLQNGAAFPRIGRNLYEAEYNPFRNEKNEEVLRGEGFGFSCGGDDLGMKDPRDYMIIDMRRRRPEYFKLLRKYLPDLIDENIGEETIFEKSIGFLFELIQPLIQQLQQIQQRIIRAADEGR